MKKSIYGGILMVIIIALWFSLKNDNSSNTQSFDQVTNGLSQDSQDYNLEIFEENLAIPWEMVFLPEGDILVTERGGTLRKIGSEELSLSVPGVVPVGEGGLLGMALHPDFFSNRWLYLYFTTREGGTLTNRVERYIWDQGRLIEGTIILSNIPASANHNGGRIAFGPDGLLYITTGDAENSNLAQNRNSLAGKILRVEDNGKIPSDNPFGNAVYSYGHRNPQGLAWDDQGRLWATEHGRSGVRSGFDELNLIEKGKNYGWPIVQGDESRDDLVSPFLHSGANMTWAPTGLVYQSGSLFFTGLRGQALYQVKLNEKKELISHFSNEWGRLRNITLGPEGNFYLLTSNTDGRGVPREGDDKVIKINREYLVK